MKRILCMTLAALLLLSAVLLLPSCAGKVKRTADYVKGDEVVIDNETPFVYSDKTKRVINKNVWGVKREYGLWDFADFCCGTTDTEQETYAFFASYFGAKPIRELVTEEGTVYYTVYSLSQYRLLYLFLEKSGEDYLCDSVFTADGREDDTLRGMVLDKDLPTAILGDKLPPECYLDFYTPEKILENNLRRWEYYYSACNGVNIPHATLMRSASEKARTFIRCMQRVSFDIDRDGESYDGYYVYDLLLEEDGSGTLYFYHLDDKDYLPDNYTYRIIQQDTIALTAEEGNALKALLVEWDFMNQPTWNPEEYMGFDGTTTYVYATGVIGGEDKRYGSNLIVMWEPTSRNAHYHIRTAIEDLVRAHITVEEGRIYNPKTEE